MSHLVGSKGQIVIEKAIRDRLGVKPGWRVLQLLVDEHVEIRLVPPEHTRSVAGRLAPHVKRRASTDEGLRDARAVAWSETAGQRMAGEPADGSGESDDAR